MLRHLAIAGFIVLAALIGLEGALRLVPSAIPLRLLQHYQSGLRIEIAGRLAIPSPRIGGDDRRGSFHPGIPPAEHGNHACGGRRRGSLCGERQARTRQNRERDCRALELCARTHPQYLSD